MANPYCFYRRAGRYYYNDAFRRFLLDLRQRHVDLDLDDFAATLPIPPDTLMEMLGQGADTGIAEPSELAPTQKRSRGTRS